MNAFFRCVFIVYSEYRKGNVSMFIRMMCVIFLGMTISFWSMIPDYKYVPEMAKIGMHILYAGGSAIFLYGIITGKVPMDE